MPLPLYSNGASSGDEINARPYFAFNVFVLTGSLLIAGLSVVALSRRLPLRTRAAASTVAWCLVWLSPLVFLLIAEMPSSDWWWPASSPSAA